MTSLIVSNHQENAAAVFIAGLSSQHSKRNMTRYLNLIAVAFLGIVESKVTVAGKGRPAIVDTTYLTVNWERLGFQHVAAIKAWLMERYAPATVNVMLSAVRGVLGAAWKLGQLSAEEYQRAIDVDNVKVDTMPAGRNVEALEVKTLLEACKVNKADAKLKDIRDAALIAVLYATGMRRDEAAKLELANYEPETGRIDILSGKGRKDRTVYIKNRAQDLLNRWIAARGQHEGALWHAINKKDVIERGRGISSQAIYNMLKTRGIEAGIAEFSPHDLRRTFVGNALDAGIDMSTVSKIAGHASTDTTRRYDRRGERVKEQAAHKIDLPI